MKAIVCTKYGAPDVLHIRDIPKPSPKVGEILIRVHASAVTTSGSYMREGKPRIARLFTGLTKPSINVQGTDLAGVVEEIGENVTLFNVGDKVFGATDTDFGAHAEYACLPENAVIIKQPVNVTHDEASAICEGALTALPFLRDMGEIKKGDKVLIIGASGAIGTAAVQLARYFGAEVTGVCSGTNAELVSSLGADTVIDYTQESVYERGEQYNIIFDTVGKSDYSHCKSILCSNGRYLSPVLSFDLLAKMLFTSFSSGKKAKFSAAGLLPASVKLENLIFLKGLMESGELISVIDKCYPYDKVVEACKYVDTGRKRGNVIINFI